MNVPWILCHQCPFLLSEPQLTSASPVNPPRPIGRSGPGFYEVTAFAQGSSACEILLHPPKAESLFPPILGSSCNQAPLAFKTKCSGNFSSCQILRLSWRAIFLWKHPFVVCVGFMLFGTRAIFSIDVCHLFSQCVLAVILLIGICFYLCPCHSYQLL